MTIAYLANHSIKKVARAQALTTEWVDLSIEQSRLQIRLAREP